jgi:hypothetical protein
LYPAAKDQPTSEIGAARAQIPTAGSGHSASPLILFETTAEPCLNFGVPYLWQTWDNRSMKEESVRTTIDIPRPLYRKLKERAAARGFSIRDLVLAGVKTVLLQGQRPRSKRVRFPLIVSEGPKVNVTSENIYEHVEFP